MKANKSSAYVSPVCEVIRTSGMDILTESEAILGGGTWGLPNITVI